MISDALTRNEGASRSNSFVKGASIPVEDVGVLAVGVALEGMEYRLHAWRADCVDWRWTMGRMLRQHRAVLLTIISKMFCKLNMILEKKEI